MAKRSVIRVLALIAVSALLAAACTSDPGETSGSAPDSSSEDPGESADSPDGDDDSGGDAGLVGLGDFAGPTEIDDTALSVDDDIRIGTLDNGLTYYVRSNDSPGSSVSLRLAIRAGGVHETPVGTGTCLLYTSPSPRDS